MKFLTTVLFLSLWLGEAAFAFGQTPLLTVNNGSGGGAFATSRTIHVWANIAPAGLAFDRWTGDTATLTNPYEAHTTLLMPQANLSITAIYKNAPTWTPISETISGVNNIYYVPPQPKGLIFLFHGSGGSAAGFSSSSEGRSFVNDAIAEGYAFAALDSEDRVNRQWNPTVALGNPDVQNVQDTVNSFIARGFITANTPLYALGMSNGGAFSPRVSLLLNFKASAIYCAAGATALLAATTVPTIWNMAANDSNDGVGPVGNQQALGNYNNLISRNIPASYNLFQPQPVHNLRFARIMGLTNSDSQTIYNSLKINGHLDADDFQIQTPANGAWLSAIPAQYNSFLGEINNQLRASYAEHQFYSDHNRRTLDFFNTQSLAQFGATTYSAGEAAPTLTVTVTRTGRVNAPASVTVRTGDSTAQQRTDYTLGFATLNFAAGETVKTFTLLINDDVYVEGDEKLHLALDNPVGVGLGSPSNALITITDNDLANGANNPIDAAQFFTRQHYLDLLSREPDAAGLAYWTGQITACGNNAACQTARRTGVSAAFFIELEFQDTGYYVYRLYQASFGARPAYAQFMPDRASVIGGANLEQGKQAFAEAFAQRPAFLQSYPATLTNAQFVNQLFDTAGLFPFTAERQAQINAMSAGRSRANVLREVIEIPAYRLREYNPAFVLTQYFGYLRRDVDPAGFDFWLNVVTNAQPGNYAGMVCAFITSAEYQQRFGPNATRSNSDCN
jgi:poly(3-hydroxybutyrate) depolymerase